MPELDQQLRAYFDVLADQAEDNVKAQRSHSRVNGLDGGTVPITRQRLVRPMQRLPHDGADSDLRKADQTAEPEHRKRRAILSAAAAAVVAIVVVMGLVLIDRNRDDVVGDLVAGGVEIDVFLDDLREVVDVDFDPSGRLFVMEHLAGMSTVEILEDGSAGAQIEFCCLTREDLEKMTLGENGALYFADDRSVYRIKDLAVESTTEFYSSDEHRPGTRPEVVAIDADGDLYVAASFQRFVLDDGGTEPGVVVTRVEILDDGSAGSVTEIVTVTGGGSHGDIEFGPTGELFVTGSTDEIWAITFADDGSMISFGVSATIPGGPTALASTASGTLYVGTASGTLWSVAPGEDPVVVANGFGRVSGLAFDDSGTLYLADGAAGEILKITTK